MFQRSNLNNKSLALEEMSRLDVTNTFIFQLTNKDSLIQLIDCLYPISTSLEADAAERQMEEADIKSMQQYIYYFWNKRHPEDPEKAFSAYLKEVSRVNESYSAQNRKGYETDRGRVYLQYGPPNIVSDGKADPAAYPYEIWQYYKLNNQSNRKFVFYSEDGVTNDFKLLHSDAYGELQEPQWDAKLHERTQKFGIDLDRDQSIDIYGSHSKEKFANPH